MRENNIPPNIKIDRELCIFCWKCVRSCPAEILVRKSKNEKGKKGYIKVTDVTSCFECRACEVVCPVEAIKVFSNIE